jgi:hypothetical protein
MNLFAYYSGPSIWPQVIFILFCLGVLGAIVAVVIFLKSKRAMMSKQSVVGAIVGMMIVGLIWCGTEFLFPAKGVPPVKGVPSVTGNLMVDYMLSTSPTSSSGSRFDDVGAIEFHTGYVVIRRVLGGNVLPADRIQRFDWCVVPPEPEERMQEEEPATDRVEPAGDREEPE